MEFKFLYQGLAEPPPMEEVAPPAAVSLDAWYQAPGLPLTRRPSVLDVQPVEPLPLITAAALASLDWTLAAEVVARRSRVVLPELVTPGPVVRLPLDWLIDQTVIFARRQPEPEGIKEPPPAIVAGLVPLEAWQPVAELPLLVRTSMPADWLQLVVGILAPVTAPTTFYELLSFVGYTSDLKSLEGYRANLLSSDGSRSDLKSEF